MTIKRLSMNDKAEILKIVCEIKQSFLRKTNIVLAQDERPVIVGWASRCREMGISHGSGWASHRS
jgi:hypothetical protein